MDGLWEVEGTVNSAIKGDFPSAACSFSLTSGHPLIKAMVEAAPGLYSQCLHTLFHQHPGTPWENCMSIFSGVYMNM